MLKLSIFFNLIFIFIQINQGKRIIKVFNTEINSDYNNDYNLKIKSDNYNNIKYNYNDLNSKNIDSNNQSIHEIPSKLITDLNFITTNYPTNISNTPNVKTKNNLDKTKLNQLNETNTEINLIVTTNNQENITLAPDSFPDNG